MKKNSRIYLEDIKTAIQKIEEYTKEGRAAFLKDGKTQDAVIKNLTVIGEATKKLPQSVRSKEPDIPWKQIAGMRDILIHDYSSTNVRTLWDTVRRDIPILEAAINRLLQKKKPSRTN